MRGVTCHDPVMLNLVVIHDTPLLCIKISKPDPLLTDETCFRLYYIIPGVSEIPVGWDPSKLSLWDQH